VGYLLPANVWAGSGVRDSDTRHNNGKVNAPKQQTNTTNCWMPV